MHEIVPAAELDAAVARVVDALLANGPRAIREAKRLIRAVRSRDVDAQLDVCAETIARVRVTPEAQEGLAAFLDKRSPQWP